MKIRMYNTKHIAKNNGYEHIDIVKLFRKYEKLYSDNTNDIRMCSDGYKMNEKTMLGFLSFLDEKRDFKYRSESLVCRFLANKGIRYIRYPLQNTDYHYTSTDLAIALNTSNSKIGSIANKYNLKRHSKYSKVEITYNLYNGVTNKYYYTMDAVTFIIGILENERTIKNGKPTPLLPQGFQSTRNRKNNRTS